MAQYITVHYRDDTDGSEDGVATYQFTAPDGVTYEIDLSLANAATMNEAFAFYISHGRRVGKSRRTSRKGPRTPRSTPEAPGPPQGSQEPYGPSPEPQEAPEPPRTISQHQADKLRREELTQVRVWARENGFPAVGDKGRVPKEVLDAYDAWVNRSA